MRYFRDCLQKRARYDSLTPRSFLHRMSVWMSVMTLNIVAKATAANIIVV